MPPALLARRAFLQQSALACAAWAAGSGCTHSPPSPSRPRTTVSIRGDDFLVNDQLTYAGRSWNGRRIEGLLLNARFVQATFDDLNPATVERWAYPDTGRWDPERNTREFVAALPLWRRLGLLAFTVNFQGGSPQGYSQDQPWENSAFNPDGTPRPAYLERMRRVLDAADRLGMVAIVGLFYFGQDQRLRDEEAVLRAVHNATDWLASGRWRNVLVEINNESNVRYDHAILQPARVHELIQRVQRRSEASGHRFLVSTSYGGGTLPGENVVRHADFLLLHGNGVNDPARIADLVRRTRAIPGYTPKPILFNEDDHFDFDRPANNFVAALSEHASWGYFDYRMRGEGVAEGFQSVPVQWGLTSDRKRGFARLLQTITGSPP